MQSIGLVEVGCLAISGDGLGSKKTCREAVSLLLALVVDDQRWNDTIQQRKRTCLDLGKMESLDRCWHRVERTVCEGSMPCARSPSLRLTGLLLTHTVQSCVASDHRSGEEELSWSRGEAGTAALFP